MVTFSRSEKNFKFDQIIDVQCPTEKNSLHLFHRIDYGGYGIENDDISAHDDFGR